VTNGESAVSSDPSEMSAHTPPSAAVDAAVSSPTSGLPTDPTQFNVFNKMVKADKDFLGLLSNLPGIYQKNEQPSGLRRMLNDQLFA
jgi:hypothetical protein